ncbi:uncharacterized protein LOC112553708 [Pomacea canaliculata]|uniref:uncharacterized protein LOC112553708 n=1 Tax=Pomacea canaliculata TaxID=400727 RepID=UPI000D730769|nr:uncharacterized protein LOC112553708 [Pomacea canaliculata]
MVQTSTLGKIAVYGAIASVAGAAYLTQRIHENLERGEYYTKSVAMLRKYGPAVELLGHPIRTKRMDLGDFGKNRVDGLRAKLTIPLKGSKDTGTLYVWASREKPGDSWDVTRLDLEVSKLSSLRTFHKTENWKDYPYEKEKT